jgi:hypothetical protein
MRSILLTALLVGCSSESSTTPVTTDVGGEVASDTSVATDTAVVTDTATAIDAAPKCPAAPPMNGDPCSPPGQKCDYPTDCGPMAGDYATCTAGGWSVVTRPCTTGDTGPG